jgi:F420-non-reducing hydrogenase small subunit
VVSERTTVAINWAGACGGCDVALLDSEHKILDLAAVADIVYWPVAMDFKRDRLESFGSGEIDIGVFNGVVRTSEHMADAQLLRDRCKVLLAFGSCAAFGGIPGLANLHRNDDLLDTVYRDTPSTDNPEDIRPRAVTWVGDNRLELPVLEQRVHALQQVVDVDVIVPGCPPPPAKVAEVLDTIIQYAATGALPPHGTVLASDNALCDECPRIGTRHGNRMTTVHRTHSMAPDPTTCFHEQGIVCMGIATRGGCGASCIDVNMPCRGCFGPTAEMLDPGAEALSAVGSIAALQYEDGEPAAQRLRPIRSIPDLVGMFFRFTLPTATIPGTVDDRPRGDGE